MYTSVGVCTVEFSAVTKTYTTCLKVLFASSLLIPACTIKELE